MYNNLKKLTTEKKKKFIQPPTYSKHEANAVAFNLLHNYQDHISLTSYLMSMAVLSGDPIPDGLIYNCHWCDVSYSAQNVNFFLVS